MKLSSSHLEAFAEVAKTRNFSLAAKNLHITQSALSQRILNLESDLTTGLIIRDPAGLRLTPAGEDLLRYCLTTDGLERELLSRLSSGQQELRGIIRIAGASSVMRSMVMTALQSFIVKNPHIQIECYSREIRELLPMLVRGEVDLIVTPQATQRHDLTSLQLGYEENVLVESAHSGKRSKVFLDHDPEDTTTLDFLKYNGESTLNIVRNYLDEVYALIDGVKYGWGQAVLARHLIKGHDDIKVCRGYKSLKVPIYLQYFTQPYYSQLQQQTVELLEKKAPAILGK